MKNDIKEYIGIKDYIPQYNQYVTERIFSDVNRLVVPDVYMGIKTPNKEIIFSFCVNSSSSGTISFYENPLILNDGVILDNNHNSDVVIYHTPTVIDDGDMLLTGTGIFTIPSFVLKPNSDYIIKYSSVSKTGEYHHNVHIAMYYDEPI